MTKKVVLKVGFHGEKGRKDVLKAVSEVREFSLDLRGRLFPFLSLRLERLESGWTDSAGINEVAVDAEKGTLTVVGNVDAVCIVNRLRKCGHTVEIVSAGPPPKPPEKPAQPNKEPEKKPDTPLPPCCHPCPPPCPPYPSPCYYEYERDPCSIM
ncbi:hypothetical protein MLD38_027456 [Melastoma candidum]|uniref:Uncharacterized protein n=1 Tax=Melastoma candidum TaxID=119954 RepID=A0ACB9P3F4_9MYRT|nr:hypothetical protein MLD38_027456 [Melastoma candidum]